jgi:hypothetical protein
MRVIDYRPAVDCARRAVDAGRPIPDAVQDLLGLRFWVRMPRCLRSTRSGAPRAGMIRHYVAALREHRAEQAAAAVILGGAR